MFKSSRRTNVEGRPNKVGGWFLAMVGRVTFRTQTGRVKQRAGR